MSPIFKKFNKIEAAEAQILYFSVLSMTQVYNNDVTAPLFQVKAYILRKLPSEPQKTAYKTLCVKLKCKEESKRSVPLMPSCVFPSVSRSSIEKNLTTHKAYEMLSKPYNNLNDIQAT